MMSRDIYRAEIALLKIIPMIIAAVYLMNTVLSYLGINLYVLSMAGGLSVLPWLFLYISSFAFHFCIYHRLFLYYIAVCDIVSYIDYICAIPISDKNYLALHITIAGIFMFIILLFKFKLCRHSKN